MAMPKNDAVLRKYQLKRFSLAQFERQKCSIRLMNENKRIHRTEINNGGWGGGGERAMSRKWK